MYHLLFATTAGSNDSFKQSNMKTFFFGLFSLQENRNLMAAKGPQKLTKTVSKY
jgi:hypothetical protein